MRKRPEIPKHLQKKVARQLLERQKRAGVYEKGLQDVGKGFLAGSAYPVDIAEMVAKPGLTQSASVKAASMRPRGGGIPETVAPVQDPKLKGTYPYVARKMGLDPDSAEGIAGSFFSLDPMAKAHAVAMGTKMVAGQLAGLGLGASVFGGLKKVDDAADVAKPIFTSPGAKATADISKETIPANKVKSQLEGRGVGKDEMEWTGFNEWIKTKKGEVSKAEIEEFFQQNQIQVQEVVRGGQGSLSAEKMEEIATNEVLHDLEYYKELIVDKIIQKQADEMPGSINDPAVLASYESKLNKPWGELPLTSKEGFARRYRLDNDLPGTPESALDDAHEEMDLLLGSWSEGTITEAEMSKLNQLMKDIDGPDIDRMYQNTLAEIEAGEYSLDHLGITGAALQTKFSDKNWQLPGGENYRELLLIVPPKKVPWKKEDIVPLSESNMIINEGENAANFYWFKTPSGVQKVSKKDWKATDYLDDLDTSSDDVLIDPDPQITQEQALEEVLSRAPSPKPRYTGGHFEENDVVAHIRFNERVDPDGNKVLFIEEIQGDWAHKGQSEGFGNLLDAETTVKLKEELAQKQAQFEAAAQKYFGGISEPGREQNDLLHQINVTTPSDFATYLGPTTTIEEASTIFYLPMEMGALNNRLEGVGQGSGVAAGPFVTDTHQWTNLALKRMIRWGSDNGFDSIAWVTGKQSADRYKVSTHVSRVKYRSDGYLSAHDKEGREVFTKYNVIPEKLVDYIGKEPANKLLKQDALTTPSGLTAQTLEGIDLDIGGEYHKLIYDQVLTAQAKKIGKKHGAKVEEGGVIASDPDKIRKLYADDFANRYELQNIRDYPEVFEDEIASIRHAPEEVVLVDENGEYLRNSGGDIIFFDNELAAQTRARNEGIDAAERVSNTELLEMFPDADEAAEKVWTMRLTDKLKQASREGLPYYVALPPLVMGAAAQRSDAQKQQSKSDAQAILAN